MKIVKNNISTNLSENTSSYTFMNMLGLYLLYALLTVQPFHFVLTKNITYYREIFAVLFSLLIIPYFFKSRLLTMRKEVFFLLLSFFTLIVFALFDPGVNLYGLDQTEGITEGLSENLLDVNLTLYVLRNAFIYIPMVCYLALRGLSEKELKRITVIVALVAPFSIVAFLYNIKFFPSFNIMDILSLGGRSLQWNSYVPYLTFPFIASLYLVVELRHKVFRLLFLAIGLFLLLYILASASRQSFLFCILTTLLVLICAQNKKKVLLILILIIICCIAYMMTHSLSNRYIVDDNLLNRYKSVAGYAETSRFEIMMDGLRLLDVKIFLFGAGLSSVIVSGPHNDFIRWTQRIGILGMVLSFLPFILSLIRVFISMPRKKKSPMLLFIFSALFFTIYHSFFGYPREDAYQALYAFLGLALWLAISKSKHISNQNMSPYLHS